MKFQILLHQPLYLNVILLENSRKSTFKKMDVVGLKVQFLKNTLSILKSPPTLKREARVATR